MKSNLQLSVLAALACTAGLVRAEPADSRAPVSSVAAPAPQKTNSHLKLCAQLGLKVGRTYEFMIAGNDEVHFWTIRSLGGRGWVLVKDSRYPETWLNLSRVIAVTPIETRPAAERAAKPNRVR